MPKKATAKPKSTKAAKTTVAPSKAGQGDIWLNVFLSIFGISLFFSGIQSLGYNRGSAATLGVVAALSGGVVLGLAMGRLRDRVGLNRRRK